MGGRTPPIAMIILGIDPGTARMGWGVIRSLKGVQSLLAFGCITTSADLPAEDRLLILRQELEKLLRTYKPNLVGVEKLFFAKNTKTALKVAEARGIVLVTLRGACIPIMEFTPLQVKQTLTGYGRADKRQMQIMVKTLLKLKDIPKPDDAADALAIAITAVVTKSSTKTFS